MIGADAGPSSKVRSGQIIVLGMHRSGTSAAMELLAECGAYVGTAEELTKPNPENPRGFFERLDARGVCDALLHGAGVDWWKVHDFDVSRIPPATMIEHDKEIRRLLASLDSHGTWALKEPRLCLLLPILRRYLAKHAVSVFVARHPVEVAQSLRRRNGFPRVAALALWEAYVVAALRHSAGMPQVILSYADLTADPRGASRKLVSALRLAGVSGLSAAKSIDIIDPSLHRERKDASTALMSSAQRKLWSYISKGERPPAAALILSTPARLILADFEMDRIAALDSEGRQIDLPRLRATEERLLDATKRAKELAVRVNVLDKERTAETRLRNAAEERAIEARVRAKSESVRAQRAEARVKEIASDLKAAQSALSAKAAEARAEAKFESLRAKRAEARVKAIAVELETAQRALSSRAAELKHREAENKSLTTMLRERDAKVKVLAGNIVALEQRIRFLKSTASWRITAPLRAIRRGTTWLRSRPAPASPATGTSRSAEPRGSIAPLKVGPAISSSKVQTSTGKAENDRARERKIERLNDAIPSPYYRQFGQMLEADRVDKHYAAIDDLIAFDLGRVGSLGPNDGPLASVVMPVLNRAALVRDAIESVLAQTYRNLELLVCDDGSTDGTREVVASIKDPRLKLLSHSERKGAAAARNSSLEATTGKYIAYLDSDNLWHPRFLECSIEALEHNEGRIACRAPYYDLIVEPDGLSLKNVYFAEFQLERQLEKPITDLNSFVHRSDALHALGGFDERLHRRQDYDLIARYTWLREPITLPLALNIYRRMPGIGQITIEQKDDQQSPALIRKKIESFYDSGLEVNLPEWVRKVTVLSWDMSRNHFAKAYSVAEALSRRVEVELISFRFFEEEIFAPLANRTPSFETKYFRGCDFPDFFGEMANALNSITGDVIYAVKPRLPSLGLALMDNCHRGTPIMLEVNDLETIAHSPGQNQLHAARPMEALAEATEAARSPYSLIWSEILDPLVAEIPVVFTHNQNLNRHYGGRCLYMRNIKNEKDYAPEGLDRASIRASLGVAEDDRIILFGGLVRKHKGINEAVELLDRLDDRKVKLLVIGSRDTPDLRLLKNKKQSRSVIFLPPQPPAEMARINFASDLVLLWLDTGAPVSHFQMPYKLTDALAMGAAVIGSPVSDLPALENAGALWTVPFADFDGLIKKIEEIFDNPTEREARRKRARRIFEREFSYGAAIANFALGAHRLSGERGTYDVSRRFAAAMASFRAALEATGESGIGSAFTFGDRAKKILNHGGNDFVTGSNTCAGRSRQPLGVPGAQSKTLGRPDPTAPSDWNVPEVSNQLAVPIDIIDVTQLGSFAHEDPHGIAVIMPCIDTEKGMAGARILAKRAGIDCRILIVNDTLRQGFINALNATAARLSVKYVVYLAEDAFPGIDWLKIAYETLERTGKGLLAFNCGKWRGRVAAFGMVRTGWVKELYGGSVFYSGYKAHKADNELTVIARVANAFVYSADAVLVELDSSKLFKENIPEDKQMFRTRFRQGFGGLAPREKLRALSAEYFVPWDLPEKSSSKKAAPDSADKRVDLSTTSFFASPLTPNEVAALKAEYGLRCLDQVPDTFALYRIIGNDLPPRHIRGQSRANLQFILENEPELEGCEKRFVVNRIHDPAEERAVIDLLKRFGARFIHIPFDPEEFGCIPFDMESLPASGFLSSETFEKFEPAKKQRLKLALYRLKNNYLMNNNGARNAALRDGRAEAKWVLPFDGNCFVTKSAWEQLRRDVVSASYLKYFVVPMARVVSNADVLSEDFAPDPVEEPQLLFRRDAYEEFDEEFYYGRRPKVEMLWRLKVAGKWDVYKDDAWDQERRPLSPEARQFGVAGWVVRLFSGAPHLETQDGLGTDQRHFARIDAIIGAINAVDAAIAGVTPETMTSLSAGVLERERSAMHGAAPELAATISQLLRSADDALTHGPFSVIDKTTLPPSGNRNDYWHPAPYWWPNPKRPDGLPYIRRDGERVPGTRMYEPESEKYDRTRLQRVFDNSLILALAWKFSGDRRYAEHGARILNRFFLDRSTCMTPHLTYGQVRMGHNDNLGAGTGIIEMKDLYFYLDAVRVITDSGAIAEAEARTFRKWLETYLSWLLNSPQGTSERLSINNHGTCYDLQVAAIASFLDEKGLVYDTLARAQARIGEQFAGDGSQPCELKRKTTAHYCCFNFQSWINLAELAARWNIDLWGYETPDGAGLKQGARWLLGHLGKPWPYEQTDEFDEDRFLPIWFAAAAHVDGLPRLSPLPPSKYHAKPVFFPHDGVRPFWNLANSAG